MRDGICHICMHLYTYMKIRHRIFPVHFSDDLTFVNSRFGGKARFLQLDTISGAIHVQTGKTTPIGRINLRENSVSRHHMGLINSSDHISTMVLMGLKGALNWDPLCLETPHFWRADNFSRLMTIFKKRNCTSVQILHSLHAKIFWDIFRDI